MKTIVMVLMLGLLFSPGAFAGEIYGNITEQEQSVGRGVRVEIKSSNDNYYSSETDQYGSYRIDVSETGNCMLTVHYKGVSPSIEVYSNEESTQYDLVLVQNEEGYSVYLR